MRRFILIFMFLGSRAIADYTTTFSATENPMSEGGVWKQGLAIGLDWENVRTTGGIAIGTQTGAESGTPAQYNDSTAILTGTWAANQSVSAVVSLAGPPSPGVIEEVEARLRSTMTASSSTGYEVLFSCLPASDGGRYVQIVRWNGALGNFTILQGVAGPGLANGDTVKGEIIGNTISAYVNGTLVTSTTDSTYSSGNPGIGFYNHNGSVATNADFGFTSMTATGGSTGTTRTAASLSPTDVQAALNSAQAGDTVVLPSGTANWTSGISWTAPANVTIIGNNGTVSTTTGGGDNTVLVDNIAGGGKMWDNIITAAGTLRFTGITIQSGSGGIKDNGTLNFDGPLGSTYGKVRIDHCHFNATSVSNYKIVRFGNGVAGVLDHCILDLTGTNAIYFYNGRTGGGGDAQGNLEWTLPTNFGTDDYFYVEDNVINGNVGSGAYSTRIFDGFTAAKVVVRFNDVSQAVLGETHATGHSPDDRGLRSQEIYCNRVTSSLAHDPNFTALDMGNGTTLFWGNSFDQVYKNIFLFKQTRKNNTTYNQLATPTGWGYAGTQFNGTGSNWDGGTALGTDTLLGYPCLDQLGRGSGDLLVGVFPSKTNQTTGTIRWPNQPLEPVYIWNNVGSIVAGWGGSTISNDSGTRITADRDFYMQASAVQTSPTSPFNGTSGTGWGTLANRPTTCTTGVGYWATDQGSWNSSTSNPYGVQQNGSDGVLYKATATNTWTAYYTPLTYPHPLQTGTTTGGGTATVGNLKVTTLQVTP